MNNTVRYEEYANSLHRISGPVFKTVKIYMRAHTNYLLGASLFDKTISNNNPNDLAYYESKTENIHFHHLQGVLIQILGKCLHP